MFNRSLCAAACFLVANAVLAQGATPPPAAPAKEVLGKAIKVEGLVTVSNRTGIIRVVLNAPVIDGTRYVTSSSGYATLHMDKGCDIELKPNQALTIDGDKNCAALWALLGGSGGSPLSPFVAGGAALLLLGGGGTVPGSRPPGGDGLPPPDPPRPSPP